MWRKIVLGLTCLLLTSVVTAAVLGRLYLPAEVERQANKVTAHNPWPVSKQAADLHKTLLIGDWHSDSLLWDRDLLKQSNYGHVDFPRLREGNVAFQVFTAVTRSPKGPKYDRKTEDTEDDIKPLVFVQGWPIRTWDSVFERARYQVKRLRAFEKRAPDEVRVILSEKDVEDVLNARQQGKKLTGALMGMEGTHALEGDIKNLDKLYDAGYRLVGLHHFFDNKVGGSLHGNVRSGLTNFGKKVVKKAIEKRMIIDVAHSSPVLVEDVIAITNVPIVLSHTGIFRHCKSRRNIPDAHMKKIASTGGVIGIGYWKDVICDNSPAGVAKAIRAAIDLVGEDHVSLGSDFDGGITTKMDISELAAITHEMQAQGFTETEIRKVMGENFLRVVRKVLSGNK